MKHAIILTRESSGHQLNWGSAFAEGLKRHGWKTQIATSYSRCDLLVMWGARRSDVAARAKADGGQACVLERAYLGDRFQWTSVSFGGGLNGRGKFNGPFHDPSRWEKFFAPLLRDWEPKEDGCALIMHQVPGDTAVSNVHLPKFYSDARAAFERLGIEVKERRHPRITPGSEPDTAERAVRTLERDLAGARCVVTWNSNSGVDAVMAGVPTVALDEGSMAWDVTGHALALPPMPDRTAWAHALAWKQWTKDEIASGYCWENVRGDL